MKRNGLVALATGAAVLLFFIGTALADNDSRDYIPAPPGTGVMVFYYKHITGNKIYSDGNKIGSDFNLKANLGIIRPIYFTSLGPFTVDPQMLLIFGDQSVDGADAGGVEMSASGIADPVIASTIWFVNDAASQTWLGFTPFITIPVGEYNKERVMNLGANRWAFKTEVGFVKGFGKFFFDLTGNAEFFGDNDDYPVGGGLYATMEQAPVFTLETHLSYDFSDSFFMSGDYYYHNGGETTVDGIDMDDKSDDHSVQLTLGFKLGAPYQLLLQYRSDIAVENGLKTNTFGARLLYAF